jgi:hypothetical protein
MKLKHENSPGIQQGNSSRFKNKKTKKENTLNSQRQQPKQGYMTYAVLYK